MTTGRSPTDDIVQTETGEIDVGRCAKAIREVAYLPVCDEMREAAREAEQPMPTSEEIYVEWSKRQARAVLEIVGLIP